MPPEIFASYSREDQAQVFPIVDKLRERGLNIWIDQEGIHGAKLWSQEIVNAIESSKVFILFASAKALVSKNVTKELAELLIAKGADVIVKTADRFTPHRSIFDML